MKLWEEEILKIHSRDYCFSSMTHHAPAFAVALAAGLVAGVTVVRAQETILLKKELGATKGEATVTIHPDIPAGATTSGKHYHLGDQIVYVLEGTGTLEVEGQPPLALKPGVVFHIAPRQVHEVKTASPGPLKGVGVTIANPGDPFAVTVK